MISDFNVKNGPIEINTIKKTVQCEIFGIDPNTKYNHISSIDSNKYGSGDTIYFLYENYNDHDSLNKDSTFVVSKNQKEKFSKFNNLIIVNDVQASIAKLSGIFYREINEFDHDALNDTKIGNNCKIASSAIIKKGCLIGDNSVIKDGVVIDYNCKLGNNVLIEENSIISNSILGDSVRIGRNTCLGQRGFGFAIDQTKNQDIFHIGRVIVQSNVSIGSNCCVDRGSFGDTIIGENTYFDNMCHIAHNVCVGRNSIFAGMCGIAGSSIIGDNVMAGGQVGISGHIKIGNNVRIAAKSAVFKNVIDNSSVMGNPAIDKLKYLKNYLKIYEK